MNRELIIDASSSEVVLALLEEKRLVELHTERTSNEFSVGDIYLGKTKKVIPGLNAAFIDVGYEKDAFLHYLDLGPQVKSLVKFLKGISAGQHLNVDTFTNDSDIEKAGKISSVLSSGQHMLVQIAKEPISSKGPRITSEISIPGRFIVLVPFSNRISISQKIKNPEEKGRLRKLAQTIRPANFGLIVRTVAENKHFNELQGDLDELMARWNGMVKSLSTAKPPQKVLGELDRSLAILRDILNDSFNSIYVNDANLYNEIKSYISTIMPGHDDIVKLHKGKTPIFEQYGVDKQIKTSFGKKVSMKSGAYLIVEPTEAFHVIDVNSGYKVDSDKNQEANALEVNLEMASEVARQLRLRDLGGIIVVDFIDMHQGLNRRKLFDKLKEEMQSDRAKHTILPPSKFGLVQITRQRVRPETKVEILEKCPVCEGTGKIKPNVLIVDEIENNLSFLIQEQNESRLDLFVSPFVYAYISQGFWSLKRRWYFRFKRKVRIMPAVSFHFLEYHIYNAKGEEIAL